MGELRIPREDVDRWAISIQRKLMRPFPATTFVRADPSISTSDLIEVPHPFAGQKACEDVEIVGGMRRGLSTIGDVVMVVLPVYDEVIHDLAAPPSKAVRKTTLYDRKIADLIEEGILTKVDRPSAKSLRFIPRAFEHVDGFTLDLFPADRMCFGNVVMAQTGPFDFVNAMRHSRHADGVLPDGVRHSGGYLWKTRGDELVERIPCRTERDYFIAAGVRYVQPEDRTLEAIQMLRAQIAAQQPRTMAGSR